MNLSRKWPEESVHVDTSDKKFTEAMTLSSSKMELTHDLGEEISNTVVGKVLSMERYPDSDRVWACQVDAGREQPVQIVTGAWNVHTSDLVPVALHKSALPGDKEIERGELRGVLSDDVLCGPTELGLDGRDFPYAAITPAAILEDYKPLGKDRPSVSADIQSGDKIYGPVVCAKVLGCKTQPDGSFHTCVDVGTNTICPDITYPNLHTGDLVTYDTKADSYCTLDGLHAQQTEFPHCIPDSIFILHEDRKPGDDLRPIINTDSHVVEFEITPNRPDYLSVIGLAREVAATYDAPLTLHKPMVKGGGPGTLTELLDVETPAAGLILRYTARVVRNMKIAPSPKWMRERLRSTGVCPINNIVDITNYVMLEYGQPTHAFDHRYVKGGRIIIRRAEESEGLTTPDGQVRKLNASHLVTADEARTVGLVGIMGGENSEIVSDTTDVVLESTYFDDTCIRKGALALDMCAEASAKFEKGLDPMNTLPAAQRACELVELLGAGEVVDGVIDIPNHIPQPRTIRVDPKRMGALLSTDIPATEQYKYLERVEIHTEQHDFPDGLADVVIPSWRAGVEGIAGLTKEVARFYGYNNIPVTLMQGQATLGGYSAKQKLENRLGALCRAFGYDEIVTCSFVSPACCDEIHRPRDYSARKSFQTLNPLGEDISIMRIITLPSMLDILAHNYNYHNKSTGLYELARVYLPGGKDGLANESEVLTLGAYGKGMGFYAIKEAIETVLKDVRAIGIHFEGPTGAPFDASCHPGYRATVWNGSGCIGIFGQIHPLATQNYNVDAELYRAELSFDELLDVRGPDPEYVPLPRFPTVTCGIAVVCGEKVTMGALEDCIRRGAKGLFKKVALFNIYRGKGVDEGERSIAFNLTLRADDCSLTSEGADADVKAVLEPLERKPGAALR